MLETRDYFLHLITSNSKAARCSDCLTSGGGLVQHNASMANHDPENSEDDSENIRVFTLTEARGLLPTLRSLLARVSKERDALIDIRPEIDRAREKAASNGGTPFGQAYLKHMLAFTAIVQKIQSLGVHVKDFKTGLVDFPYEHDGRIVFLCWRPDEDEIGWWHEIEAGFAGRRPLGDDLDEIH